MDKKKSPGDNESQGEEEDHRIFLEAAMTISDTSKQPTHQQAQNHPKPPAAGTPPTEWQMHRHEPDTYIPPAIADKPFFVSFAWRYNGEKYLKQPARIGDDGNPIIKADDGKPVGIDALAAKNQHPYDTSHTGFVAQGGLAGIDWDTPQPGYEDEQRQFREEFEECTYHAKSHSNVMSDGEIDRYHSIAMCDPSILPKSKFSCPKLGIDFLCNNKQGMMLSGEEVNLLDVTDQTPLVKALMARMRELNGEGANVVAAKPKRKRRTKKEIEQDKAAAAVIAGAEEGIGEGNRQNTLIKDYCAKLHNERIDLEMALEELKTRNDEWCVPKMEDKELVTSFNSMLKSNKKLFPDGHKGQVNPRDNLLYYGVNGVEADVTNRLMVLGLELRMSVRGYKIEVRRKPNTPLRGCLSDSPLGNLVSNEWESMHRHGIDGLLYELLTSKFVQRGNPQIVDGKINGGYLIAAPNLTERNYERVIENIAMANEVDPLLEWIMAGDKWDRKDRIKKIVKTFFKYENADGSVDKDSRAMAEWGWKVTINGLVARAITPGRQLDALFLLIGDGGIGKTACFRMLLPWGDNPHRRYYTKYNPAMTDGNRLSRLQGSAIAAFDEMPRATKHREVMKDDISEEMMVARLPYGKRDIYVPARHTFVGSINDGMGTPVRSFQEGGRRFIVSCVTEGIGKTAMEKWYKDNRYQLLRQAYEQVSKGKIDFEPKREVMAIVERQVEATRAGRALEDIIDEYLAYQTPKPAPDKTNVFDKLHGSFGPFQFGELNRFITSWSSYRGRVDDSDLARIVKKRGWVSKRKEHNVGGARESRIWWFHPQHCPDKDYKLARVNNTLGLVESTPQPTPPSTGGGAYEETR